MNRNLWSEAYMAKHEFGIMMDAPQPGKRYDEYEPWKYDCIFPLRIELWVMPYVFRKALWRLREW